MAALNLLGPADWAMLAFAALGAFGVIYALKRERDDLLIFHAGLFAAALAVLVAR